MSFEEMAVLAAADYARGVLSRDMAELMKSGFVNGAQGQAKADLRNYNTYESLIYTNAYAAGLEWHLERTTTTLA